ncbi:hypothetical protein SOCEGT47_009300 [Sorangium cellulosum]|jgi:hypothetical protein|uniref:Uncharacterized protein n=1 Tax=Sorangium cellulosum TaxID=56 RepID=A0A4P2PUW7_SORCE|nr:hypothetical protein [Sorangium cellulosum]AUX20459.1 hypothetical protein SOCEGT47_009300 [Sorangium cellulosum]
MRALCPACGFHHEVVRVLDDGRGDQRKDVYQVAPLVSCDRTWISDAELLEAQARFGQEAILPDDDE